WRTGTFRYEPATEFQAAVHMLFRQSWRAKVCPRCGRHFIGDKPAQSYCSSACYGSVKRDRDLQHWRTVGDLRRRERNQRVKRVTRSSKVGRGRKRPKRKASSSRTRLGLKVLAVVPGHTYCGSRVD